MLVVVTLISTLVHLFSIGYMTATSVFPVLRLLGFFSFSMLMIVLANNLFLLYVGWNSLHQLVSPDRHWYEKKSASNAAIKAFLVNRVGDFGFFLGIAMLFMTFHTSGSAKSLKGSSRPAPVREQLVVDRRRRSSVLRGCRQVGANFRSMCGSPMRWKPHAVSALIHAATMVAAGVYRSPGSSPS